MRTPTKKRPPMEMEPGEGKAHEIKESPEEEVREGTESEEGEDYGKKSRKRSAKGSKNTKAPMDCEGCAGKKTGKCKECMARPMKDSGCGGPMKKRSDALTAPEYLAACELGIQNRSRTYIRARLDAAATKAKAMETELRKQGEKKGLSGDNLSAYVYGTLNKVGYKEGSKTTSKGKAKVKKDSMFAAGFSVDYDQLSL